MSDCSSNAASVIVVPRERGSLSLVSLRSVVELAGTPFELIYVDCVSNDAVSREIEAYVDERGGHYVRIERYVYPNQARNLGAKVASGEFLVFVDNDIIAEADWLKSLVACAQETGAGLVGPIYLEGDREQRVVHCAGGGIAQVTGGNGEPMIVTKEYHAGESPSAASILDRKPTGLIEFHCVLVSRECLNAIGGELDEGLKTTREHVDLCLQAREAGFEIYLEPRSRMSYLLTEQIQIGDLPYFLFRWSDKATRETIKHFERKWRVRLDPERRRIIGGRRSRAVTESLQSVGLDRLPFLAARLPRLLSTMDFGRTGGPAVSRLLDHLTQAVSVTK